MPSLGGLRIRSFSELLLEQLLGICPYTGRVSLGQLEEGRQEIMTELLGGLAREQCRQVVDRDHAQRRVAGAVTSAPFSRVASGSGAASDSTHLTSTPTVGSANPVFTL
jgi:hypothetical protein